MQKSKSGWDCFVEGFINSFNLFPKPKTLEEMGCITDPQKALQHDMDMIAKDWEVVGKYLGQPVGWWNN